MVYRSMNSMKSLLLILTCLTASASQRPAVHFSAPQMMTVARRDKLHFFTPQPKVDSRASAVAPVPFYTHMVEFDTNEPVNALGVQETTDMRTWRVVYEDAPHLWIGLGHKQIKFTTPNQNAYWRAFVRNQDSP